MQVNFRHVDAFGTLSDIGVHQVCDQFADVENALYNAERDGFSAVFLYVADEEDMNWFLSELPEAWHYNVKLERCPLDNVIHFDFKRECSNAVVPAERTVAQAKRERGPDKHRVSAGCRWFPRLGVYKGDHFHFDPKAMLALSYRWYPMLQRIGARIVMNECRYSNQTSKDFYRLYECMRREGIKAHCAIYAPKGLDDLGASLAWYARTITKTKAAMAKRGSHKRKNAERRKEIARLRKKITLVRSLMKAAKAAERRMEQRRTIAWKARA